ncbi:MULTISPECIES: hypothetical protein [unclassified Micromonospora]|uniref:hypothetical protein n=1 Tax=unclassified Micromonospora TaxID=2617518 RepID=UPI0033214D70
MSLLDQIDRAIDGLCPCGAEPREGSAYCGSDCEPTHISNDTDERDTGWLSTPMRWRPDLVTASDDTDLIPLGSETHGYTGRFNAQVYERASDPAVWHLRLDDGHRFVGVDLPNVGGRQDPITDELVGRVREAWQRLEQELTDPAKGYDPWAGWSDVGYIDETEDPWADVMAAALSHGQAVVVVRPSSDELMAELAGYRPAITRARRAFHNQPVHAVDVSAGSLAAVVRASRESLRPVAEAAEQFLRQWGGQLSAWQRDMVEQIMAMQVSQPRRFGVSAAVQAQFVRLGFRPLVNGREAAILAEHGLREGVDFARCPAAPERDEPLDDPMLRAIEAKKRRNTGPPKDRLDGRRRRRR